MKRRKFIRTSTVISISVIFPIVGCSLNSSSTKIVAIPNFLSKICNKDTIIKIGKKYRELIKTEDDKNVLTSILIKEKNKFEKINLSVNKMLIQESFGLMIENDFKTNNTIIVDGWVLSITEARQCALFSLTKN